MANVPTKTNGQALNAANLFKFVGDSQTSSGSGSVGSQLATVTIAANQASQGILILWNFTFIGGNSTTTSINAELSVGPTGSEVMKIQKEIRHTDASNNITRQMNFAMWFEDGLDFGVENTVIVGTSSANNASLVSISLVVLGV